MPQTQEKILNINFLNGIVRDGIVVDLADGYVYDARHVQFDYEACQKMAGRGYYNSTALSNKPIGLHIFKGSDGNVYRIVGTKNKLYKFNTSTYTEIGSGYTANDTDFWDFAQFGFYMLATNGVDSLKKFITPYSAVENVGGSPPVAKIVTVCQRHVVLINLPSYPYRIVWSDIEDYETWTPASDNEAGDVDLVSQTPPIAGDSLGDMVAIYSKTNIFIMQYIGGTLVFSFKPVTENIGILAPRLLANMIDVHYFMGNENFYSFDGVRLQPIGDAIKREILGSINKDYIDQAFTFHDFDKGQVWFCIPTGSSTTPNLACIFNFRNGSWSLEDIDFLCGTDSVWADYPLIGNSDYKIVQVNYGTTDVDGSNMTATLETGDYLFDTPNKKMIYRIYPFVKDQNGTIYFRIGYRDRLDDDITWTSAKSFSNSDYKIDFRHTPARYLRLKIYSDYYFELARIKCLFEETSKR